MPNSLTPESAAEALCAFIDASPSPFHACETAAAALTGAGFAPLDESESWSDAPTRGFVRRGGSLVAWAMPDEWSTADGFRIVGAHTDSPNLRIKPRPDTGRAGVRQLGVEVYGGALLNTWLDRDLGVSGRVSVRREQGVELRTFRIDEPLLRIPQLAIHLDRDINERGLKLDRQAHLAPLWALGAAHEGEWREFLADQIQADPADVLAWDAMVHDLTPSTLLGRDRTFVSAPRIDNLASCWAAVTALVASPQGPGPAAFISLYDHEEVGSTSARGADGVFLRDLLARLLQARHGDTGDLARALAVSWCASADGAHATNPNYVERHEPEHRISIGGGPVVKHNVNERYATDAESAGWFLDACGRAGIEVQHFVTRSDLPCGSTIGPVTAARLGVRTVDVGLPQLAMHSARELCGRDDLVPFVGALEACLTS